MDTGDSQIYILNEQSNYSLDEIKLKQISAEMLRVLGLSDCELCIRFVDSNEIKKLNYEYRQKNKSTDVLSFPQLELQEPITIDSPFQGSTSGVPEPLGDIVISLQDAANNARDIGQSLSKETAFLIIHGILHLAGHDHILPDEERNMLEQQRLMMNQLEDIDPPLWQGCIAEFS